MGVWPARAAVWPPPSAPVRPALACSAKHAATSSHLPASAVCRPVADPPNVRGRRAADSLQTLRTSAADALPTRCRRAADPSTTTAAAAATLNDTDRDTDRDTVYDTDYDTAKSPATRRFGHVNDTDCDTDYDTDCDTESSTP